MILSIQDACGNSGLCRGWILHERPSLVHATDPEEEEDVVGILYIPPEVCELEPRFAGCRSIAVEDLPPPGIILDSITL
jgi:hypothetical protein